MENRLLDNVQSYLNESKLLHSELHWLAGSRNKNPLLQYEKCYASENHFAKKLSFVSKAVGLLNLVTTDFNPGSNHAI
jgi:hypothetical protein